MMNAAGKDTAMASMDCLAPRGMLVFYGNSSGSPPAIEPLLLSEKGSLSVCRPKLHDFMRDESETNWRGQQIMGPPGGLHPIKLTLQGVVPLAKVREAHMLIESGATTGKILLKI
jgi:NADPH2:quinone reductase